MNAAIAFFALTLIGQCPGGQCAAPGRAVYRPRVTAAPVVRYAPRAYAPAPYAAPQPALPAPASPVGWHYTLQGWVYGTRVGAWVFPAA